MNDEVGMLNDESNQPALGVLLAFILHPSSFTLSP